MSQPKLPVRIKVDVRDQFEAPTSAVQKAFVTLGGIIGLKVSCNVEWDLLYHSLEASFDDKSTFVPCIIDVVVAWCDVLSTRLEDDHFAEWTEEVIEKVSHVGMVKVLLQVSNQQRPRTTWSDDHRCFMITFPAKTLQASHNASSGFESDFQELFSTTRGPAESVDSLPIRNKDDEWAEIDETGEAASINVSSTTPTRTPVANRRPQRMPTVTSIPTPDVLTKTMTPYVLHISQAGSTVTVTGTHSPTLQFLSQYLQRWIKKDHQDIRKVPLLNITLHESNFGIGISHDKLTIEPYETHQERRGIAMNVTVILAIVENLLGYDRLPRVSGGLWEYRRDTPLE